MSDDDDFKVAVYVGRRNLPPGSARQFAAAILSRAAAAEADQ